MALFVWVAVATAFWHFTIFVPDRFAGGMVGAFVWANAGALLTGFLFNRASMPPIAEVGHADAALGAVGGLLGLGAAYAYGVRSHRVGATARRARRRARGGRGSQRSSPEARG